MSSQLDMSNTNVLQWYWTALTVITQIRGIFSIEGTLYITTEETPGLVKIWHLRYYPRDPKKNLFRLWDAVRNSLFFIFEFI
jgi:hypothetical protein